MKVLPSGVYQYRFVVDGRRRYAPDLPWAQDDAGNAYNVLDLQVLFYVDIFSMLTNLICDGHYMLVNPIDYFRVEKRRVLLISDIYVTEH